ncbi:MAG: D-glycero-beta-D-manno-heptose-7-phosphate kinase [Bacteroidetes bacterium]|nr:D-glycero-beta-D-manno-heptose-7-phosphate kinase [Bacteroidota bacterium]
MQQKEVIRLFDSFNDLNVLIIGDVMVDSYIWGKVERISPEAPVPVVSVKSRENRLGGAANVALNIKALGANPVLCSVVGNDQKGNEFISLMKEQNMVTDGILRSRTRITTAKFRVIGNNMQMLRVDEETDQPLSESDAFVLADCFERMVRENRIDVIIFQDYDKGVVSEILIKKVVNIASKKNIPVAVDPKKRNFKAYRNVSLFKPNLKELKEGLNLEFDVNDELQLKQAVGQLHKLLNYKIALLTLSEMGVFIEYPENGRKISRLLPSHIRSVSDVSGAGDSVISVASLCLAVKAHPEVLAALSNLAGGLVCEKPGVVPVDKKQLINEALALQLPRL